MPFALTPKAKEILIERGWYENDRVLRKPIVPEVAKVLKKHVSPEDAISNDKLCLRVFGHSDESLRYIMAQLTSPGFNGRVQQYLNGQGYMLCTASVTEIIAEANGGEIERRVSGRFISNDPDIVERYLLEKGVERQVSGVGRLANLMKLAVKRIPTLEPRIQPRIRELQHRVGDTFAREFPALAGGGRRGEE